MSNIVIDIVDFNNYSKIVYLDDKSFFKLSNKVFFANKIKKNLEIENFNNLLIRCIYPAIKYKIISLLSKKDYSEQGIYKKIYDYGYSNEYSNPIIEEFKKNGYIDDYNYCKNLISLYQERYGIYKIKEKLYLKLIAKDVINTCINEVDINSETLIKEYLKKVSDDMLTDYKEKNKLIRKLMYKGFVFNEIKYAIEDEIYDRNLN